MREEGKPVADWFSCRRYRTTAACTIPAACPSQGC